MITYRQVDKGYLEIYDKIPMKVHVESEYKVEKIEIPSAQLQLPVKRPE